MAIGAVIGVKVCEHLAERRRLKSYGDLATLFQPFRGTSWTADHPDETRQTFEDFTRMWVIRPNQRLKTIYIQPLGEFQPVEREALEAAEDLLGRLYRLPVKELAPLGLEVIPSEARRLNPDTGELQIQTGYVREKILRPARPVDAAAMLAFTTTDLWPGEGWNFVFGEASLHARVGVWSLNRYGDPDSGETGRRLYLLRTLKIAAHETGHMFGIPHCAAFRCGMNGSNGLMDTDTAPLAFCPECSAKILWATGAKPMEWHGKLAAFARAHGLIEEARLWERAAESVKQK